MFEGVIQSVDIHQKPEMLHFGPTANTDGYTKGWRNLVRTALTNTPAIVEISANTEKFGGVVDVIDLTTKLASQNSAQFALQMIEGVEKVRFTIAADE